jgi:putative flippase GtrA
VALTELKRGEIREEALEPMPAEWRGADPAHYVDRRAVLVQFLQFCLVGVLSTALNEFLFNLFLHQKLGLNFSYILSFCIAVTNGFFVNRAWTFRRSRSTEMKRQYTMFFAVNLVGLGLSLAVMRVVGAWLLHTGWAASQALLLQQWLHHPVDASNLAHSLGVLAATPPCAVWNFGANKLWTFGGPRQQG